MHTKSSWLRFLVVIYSIAFCFLLVAASVTAYVLSHPELGLKETNPIVRDYVSKYGLELGLLLVNLYNFGTIFFAWILFISYLALSKKYRWKKTLADLWLLTHNTGTPLILCRSIETSMSDRINFHKK